jgi:tagatose-1,6-bisphosphate aldolase
MLTGVHKMQRMALAQTFLELYHKDGDEFLSHIITGDKTWVSLVNVETKEKSKQWMHTHSPNKLKSLNKCYLPESLWQLFSETGKEC